MIIFLVFWKVRILNLLENLVKDPEMQTIFYKNIICYDRRLQLKKNIHL